MGGVRDGPLLPNCVKSCCFGRRGPSLNFFLQITPQCFDNLGSLFFKSPPYFDISGGPSLNQQQVNVAWSGGVACVDQEASQMHGRRAPAVFPPKNFAPPRSKQKNLSIIRTASVQA